MVSGGQQVRVPLTTKNKLATNPSTGILSNQIEDIEEPTTVVMEERLPRFKINLSAL